MTAVHNTLLLLALALAQQTTHLVGAQCAQTKHKRSAQTFATASSSSSVSAGTATSTSTDCFSATITTLSSEIIALLAELKNEALDLLAPRTAIKRSTSKRESCHAALLPDGKHFLLSEGKKLRIMCFEGKTWKCVDELVLNSVKVHGVKVMIAVDGKFVPLDTTNEKLVAKDWHNCILVSDDWSNALKVTNLKKVYKDLTILKTLEQNTSVRCYRIPTQGSESCFTIERLQ